VLPKPEIFFFFTFYTLMDIWR